MSQDARSTLEERTAAFARAVRQFVRRLPRTISNIEDVKQVVRSSGSVGANYIEAQEALSRKDFLYRIRVMRKEAKESQYWLSLINTGRSPEIADTCSALQQEANELIRIMSAILKTSSSPSHQTDT